MEDSQDREKEEENDIGQLLISARLVISHSGYNPTNNSSNMKGLNRIYYGEILPILPMMGYYPQYYRGIAL